MICIWGLKYRFHITPFGGFYYNKMPFKNKEKRREYFNGYMREYSKKPSERIKQRVRLQTSRIYGKTPEGYERHHINYDSPHNFILIPIKKHREIHKKCQDVKNAKNT